jgi:hypothetical protein
MYFLGDNENRLTNMYLAPKALLEGLKLIALGTIDTLSQVSLNSPHNLQELEIGTLRSLDDWRMAYVAVMVIPDLPMGFKSGRFSRVLPL